MSKLAVFVEGFTEQIFFENLIDNIAHRQNIRIRKMKARGGSLHSPRILELESEDVDTGQKHFVLIVCSSNDNRVASDIKEQYNGLVRSGYSVILGFRDLYPIARTELARLEKGLYRFIPTQPINVQFEIAVMETEAWFLSEHTHFQRIDAALTVPRISQALGFDPSVDDMTIRPHPAEDMNNAYRLVGKSYTKSRIQLQETVSALDYGQLYFDTSNRLPPLKRIISAIDTFLDS